MRRKRSRWQVQHVTLAFLVVFLVPLLIALLSWATSLPSLPLVIMLLLALLVAAAGVFGMLRNWGRVERRPLRTR